MPLTYDARTTGLLQVDPYNDFISEGGKLWERSRETIEQVGLLQHTRELIAAAERVGLRRFIVPHRRWQPGDYSGWDHHPHCGHRDARQHVYRALEVKSEA